MLALQYLLESCKKDIEYLQDSIFSSTLNIYNQPTSVQYMSALNRLNINSLIEILRAIDVKRKMLNSIVLNNNTTNKETNAESNSVISRVNSLYLPTSSSSESLLFPIEDIL